MSMHSSHSIGDGERKLSTLEAFLADVHFVCPNLNDTFHYAAADSEQLCTGDGELLHDFYLEHGWHGLVALTAIKRGAEPIREVRENENYIAARVAADANAELVDEVLDR